MYVWPVTYEDFNGRVREEEFCFHLSEAELTMLNLSYEGGMEQRLHRIMKDEKGSEIITMFRDILRRSYGVKSDDGRRFIKNDEVYYAFEQTDAYSKIFMELCTNSTRASEFASGIMPKNLAAEVEKKMKEENVTKLPSKTETPSAE